MPRRRPGRLHTTLLTVDNSRKSEIEHGIKGIYFPLFLPRSLYTKTEQSTKGRKIDLSLILPVDVFIFQVQTPDYPASLSIMKNVGKGTG